MSSTEIRELYLYIVNTEPQYRQAQTIMDNLAKKVVKGTYDEALALKAWQNLADRAASQYDREYGSDGGSMKWISKADRTEVAKQLQEYFQEELDEKVEKLGGKKASLSIRASIDVLSGKSATADLDEDERAYRRGRMAGLSDEYSGKSYLEIFNLYLKKYGKGNTGLLMGTFRKTSEDWSGRGYPCYSATCKNSRHIEMWLDTQYWLAHMYIVNELTGSHTREVTLRFLYDAEYGTPIIRPEYGPKSFEKFSESMDYGIFDSYEMSTRYESHRRAIKTPSPVTVRKEWHRHNSSRRTIR